MTLNKWFPEQRRLESELRRMKRRSRKTAVVVETKIEVVHVKSDEEKKNERDEIMVKLCMANPKWSHVIHYHNKITKHGIKLVRFEYQKFQCWI